MRSKVSLAIEVLLLGFIAFFCICGAVVILGYNSKLWSQEAAGWAQAIGSIAAVGTAIWLATNESRTRKSHEIDRAMIKANTMYLKLIHSESALRTILQEMARPFHWNEAAFTVFAGELQKAILWTAEDIDLLIPLEKKIAINLAFSLDRMVSCQKVLANYIYDPDRNDSAYRAEFARLNIEILSNAHVFVQSAIEEIKALNLASNVVVQPTSVQ